MKVLAVISFAVLVGLAGLTPPAALAQEATLLPGLGDHHHHPVATTNREAQAFFDQGLRLIYAFNHDEAARAFRRAAELDPAMPMAYWGIAKAVGPNYNLPVDEERARLAYENIRKAESLAVKAPEHERAYIAALATLYTAEPEPDYRALMRAYREAMKDLSQRYPDDLDAATLYAESIMNMNPWRLWDRDGTPADGTLEAVRVLESVLRRDPMHIGANHLYIHAVEPSDRPERALAAADRLADLAPNAGHLVHMPSHIYLRLGDYTAARKANERAARVDEAYIQATGATGIYPLMYYSHNLHFIAAAAGMEGRFADARQAAERLARHVAPHIEDLPPLEPFAMIPTAVLLRFERWDDILALPAPDPKMENSTTMWHFARGMARANQGRPAEAKKALGIVQAAAAATPEDEIWAMPFNNRTRDVLMIATHVLRGNIEQAQDQQRAAIDSFRRAVAIQDGLYYGEPPDWYFPVREALGAALLAAGEAARAEEVYRADLRQHPRNGRSLHGLAESLERQGRTHEARLVERRVETAWQHADTPLRRFDVATGR